jgi:hypothetical protein
MKTRTLSQGRIVEAYNKQLRIRLHRPPDQSVAIVTIFHLKPNGYYYRKTAIRLQQPVNLRELIETYELLT